MTRAWQKLDLEGGGLQSANLRLVRRLKHRKVAYLMWFLFPLGGHRIYLDDLPRALQYATLTATALILRFSLSWGWALVPAATGAAWALYDLAWIDRRVTALNKRIRVAEYLHAGTAPPTGFSGHYTDGDPPGTAAGPEAPHNGSGPPDSETLPHGGGRVPSFAEQERLLRELARRK